MRLSFASTHTHIHPGRAAQADIFMVKGPTETTTGHYTFEVVVNGYFRLQTALNG